jgi:DNA-binding NarL/FixJ family response regulator
MLNWAISTRPHIVIIGAWLAESGGVSTLVRIRKECPECKFIIFSLRTDEEYLNHTLRSGVSGHLGKDATCEELHEAVKIVAAGKTYFPPVLARSAAKTARAHKTQPIPLTQLTPRQRETLRLIAEGNTTKEIAFLLKVSIKTVETHRAHLMERLNIYNVPGLVRFAMRTGLIGWDT